MNYFNQYGRCVVAPSETLKEAHGKNQCAIYLYKLPQGYLFGYDVVVGDIIASRRPLQSDSFLSCELEAKHAAKKAVFAEISVSRKAKKLFADFALMYYEQLELF